MNVIKFEDIEDKILQMQGKSVLLDSDVAKIYNVETKRINEAVKNNPDKFPEGYIIYINEKNKRELVENFDRFNSLKHSTVSPKAFTEKGLYMLATILKSPIATSATLAIIETFTKIRALNKAIRSLSKKDSKEQQQLLIKRSGEIFSDILDDGFETTGTETSVEINFAVLKLKHTLKKSKKSL